MVSFFLSYISFEQFYTMTIDSPISDGIIQSKELQTLVKNTIIIYATYISFEIPNKFLYKFSIPIWISSVQYPSNILTYKMY